MIDFDELELAVLHNIDANPHEEFWWCHTGALELLAALLRRAEGDEVACAHALRSQIEDRYGADALGLVGVGLVLDPGPALPTSLLDVVEWLVAQVVEDVRRFSGHKRIWMKRQLKSQLLALWDGPPF